MRFNLSLFKLNTVGIAKPHFFVYKTIKSNLDLSTIVGDLTKLVPQFKGFIEQFNTLINDNCVNVLTDAKGNLFIDVPNSMPEDKSVQISNKVSVLDRLIKAQSESIGDLFKKGSSIESKFKANNANYTSELNELRKTFISLKDSYKH